MIPLRWRRCARPGPNRLARSFSEVKGKAVGEIVAQAGSSLTIQGQGGFIEGQRLRWEAGKKIPSAEAGLAVGIMLGR
jgi:hypothetical protein